MFFFLGRTKIHTHLDEIARTLASGQLQEAINLSWKRCVRLCATSPFSFRWHPLQGEGEGLLFLHPRVRSLTRPFCFSFSMSNCDMCIGLEIWTMTLLSLLSLQFRKSWTELQNKAPIGEGGGFLPKLTHYLFLHIFSYHYPCTTILFLFPSLKPSGSSELGVWIPPVLGVKSRGPSKKREKAPEKGITTKPCLSQRRKKYYPKWPTFASSKI